MAGNSACEAGFGRIGLGIALAILWPFVGVVSSPAAAEEPVTVIGIALSNTGDTATIDGVVVDAESDSSVRAIGVSGSRGHDTIINIGAITVDATATSSFPTGQPRARASATGISSDGATGRPNRRFPAGRGPDDGPQPATPTTAPDGHDAGDHADRGRAPNGRLKPAALKSAPDARDDRDPSSMVAAVFAWIAERLPASWTDRRFPRDAGAARGPKRDTIVNDGSIEVTATATALGSQAPAAADAEATGLEGGPGPDAIVNNGSVTVTASSQAMVAGGTLNIASSGTEDARTRAGADATGIDGGTGGDTIFNDGPLTVRATSSADRRGMTINVSDAATVDASVTAEARGTGIAGGQGNDAIANGGAITVEAEATANSTSVALDLVDSAVGDVSVNARATATGIAGGQGNDLIGNAGSVTVRARADASVTSGSAGLADLSITGGEGSSGVTSDAGAAGMTGGRGNDRITNTGVLDVQSDSTVDITSVSIDLFDAASDSDMDRRATAMTTGIAGNQGNDGIVNSGTLAATANATVNTMTFEAALIGGSSDFNSSSQASAGAIGIDGGGGNDRILNQGPNTVAATALANSDQVIIDLLSAVQGESVRAPLGADAAATGIVGGQGNDWIDNSDTLQVTADATAEALEIDLSAVDLSSGGTTTASEAAAVGIDGGQGLDVVLNQGDMTVGATATTDLKQFSVSLINLSVVPGLTGTAVDSSTASKADATGIIGGIGHDRIANHGTMTVTADADTDTLDFLWASQFVTNPLDVLEFPELFDQPLTDAGTTAEAYVIGIDSGKGHDTITNTGTLASNANADVRALNVRVGFPVPDDLTVPALNFLPSVFTVQIATESSTGATGVRTGEGHDSVLNEGAISADAKSNSETDRVAVTVKPATGGGGDDDGGSFSLSLGAGLFDVSALAEAAASGVETGKGHDRVVNKNDITAKATADAEANNVIVDLEQSGSTVSVNVTLAKASTEGTAGVVGVQAGSGHDAVVNEGEVLAESLADTNSNTIVVDAQILKDTRLGIDAKLLDANTEAESSSLGIAGGTGHDALSNSGTVTARATSNADAVAVDVGVRAQSATMDVAIIGQGAWISTDTIARAEADGIVGGDGKDDIRTSGTVDADAFADANGVGVAVLGTGTKRGASLGVALVQSISEADARSLGVGGGTGQDRIINSGLVKSTADADADAVDVAVSLSLTDKGVALTGTAADGSTKGTSRAQGISGDEGRDLIHNDGTVDVLADADAQTVSVAVSAGGANNGVGLGIAFSRATSEAEAGSSGVSGGDDRDSILNSGLVKSYARSRVVAGSGALAGGGAAQGVTLQGAAADGSAMGTSTAVGISGGQDRDSIQNDGTVDVLADADTDGVSVAVSVNGTSSGVALGIGLARATTEASASGTGIAGGGGDDAIVNTDLVKTRALAAVVAGSGALAAGGTGTGVTFEGAGADGSATGRSTATGIGGGGGEDQIRNDGTVDVLADTDTTSVSIAVSGNGAGTGVAIGVAAARAVSEAEANSTGIAGGDSRDIIVSTDLVKSHALSDVAAVSVSAAVGGVGTGLAIEGAGADAGTMGSATALGIAGDRDNDYIRNDGTVDVLADTHATGVSVTVSGSGAGTGVGAGLTLLRADTRAFATAAGIALGGSNEGREDDDPDDDDDESADRDDDRGKNDRDAKRRDNERRDQDPGYGRRKQLVKGRGGKHRADRRVERVDNTGTVTATSLADAGSVGVSVQLGITGTGLQAGGALANARTMAEADATGIEGTDKDDVIVNHGTVEAVSDADATATSVSVSFNVALTGATLGAAVTDATTTAEADSTGISGKEGHDLLSNEGSITARSDAFARATSVAVAAGVSFVPLNAAVAESTATARTAATAMDGGEGDDYIQSNLESDGTVLAEASSIARGVSVAVAPIGAALGTADVDSTATATGIAGGAGHDTIVQGSDLSGTATSDATGTTVNVTLLGAAGTFLERAMTTGDAQGTGLSAGDGHDYIANRGTIDAGATTTVTGTTVSVTPTGFGLAETTTIAAATATGIEAGMGGDRVDNTGKVTARSDASAKAVSVAAGFQGFFKSDASSTVTARSIGIDLGQGHDEVLNEAMLDIDANSIARSVSGSGTFAGVAMADASSTANADATGIDGGTGDDVIVNLAPIIVSAGDPLAGHDFARCAPDDGGGACARSLSVSVGLAGVALADASSTANASATGLDGADGDDAIQTLGGVTVTALARGDADGVSVGLFGASNATAETTADAATVGIAGGAGADYIGIDGAVAATSGSETLADSTSVEIVGATSSNADTTTNAAAVGVDGGGGDDAIVNRETGTVTAGATSTSTTSGSSWTFAGSSASEVTLGALTQSTGIAGGAGDDWIDNQGLVDVDTRSSLSATGEGDAIFGNARVGSSVTADAAAVGIDGGDGDDSITTVSRIDVDSNAVMSSDATVAAFASGATTTELVTANAAATGVAGGDGRNSIRNEGDITVDAAASLSATGRTDSTFGDSSSGSTVTAGAHASGLIGGQSDDVVVNLGSVAVTANATPTSDNDAEAGAFFVDGETRSFAQASLSAQGVDLGDGTNAMLNEGRVDVRLLAGVNTFAQAKGTLILGIGLDVDARATARSTLGRVSAVGVRGADGSDLISSPGDIVVAATPGSFASADEADGDGLDGDGVANATARADGVESIGVSVGGGDDAVAIFGTLRSTAAPAASARAVSDADELGDAASTATVSANDTLALGIDAGGGGDAILNGGTIVVSADPSANRAFAGADGGVAFGEVDATATANSNADRTEAVGIAAGAGDDAIVNEGQISVAATPQSIADANGDGDGAGADGTATATARAGGTRALGIDAGDGDDLVANEGTVSARAASEARADAAADGDLIGATARGTATASTDALALGLRAGLGYNIISSSGEITAQVTAIADAEATANRPGSSGGDGRGVASATSTASADGTGIAAEGSRNAILQAGTMTVSVDARAAARTDAESDATRDGRASPTTATARSGAVGIHAAGVENAVANTGEMVVAATGAAASDSQAESDSADGNATAVARATFTAGADGVRTGAGTDRVDNAGRLQVSASATTTSDADADGGGIDGDARATTTSSSLAIAAGIRTEAGNDDIVNDGEIIVAAAASADADSFAEEDAGDTSDERAEANAFATAQALGVDTGSGNDVVVNNGTLLVAAVAGADARADTEDEDTEIRREIAVASAIGIWTGSGNDLVVNDGAITAVTGSSSQSALAIGTGSGADAVVLGDGSSVTGRIDLGLDDDALQLSGTPVVNGSILDGGGTDTLVFDGAGSFANPLNGFEIAVKQDLGTFVLPGLATMRRIEANQGTLQIGGDYPLAPGGVFQAVVYGDGTHGRFDVAGRATLDGALIVGKGPGPYTDGTTYDVLTASLVDGAFDSETLPEPSALVRFSVAQQPTAVVVEASVGSFHGVADSDGEHAVAGYLDDILPTATGDLAEVLGTLQDLPRESDFDAAFAGLSPDDHDSFRLGTVAALQDHIGAVHDRIAGLRARHGPRGDNGRSAFLAGGQPLLLTSTGAVLPRVEPSAGAWFLSFSGDDEHPASGRGHGGFEFDTSGMGLGFDYPLGDRSILGFGFASTFSDVDFDAGPTESEIDGLFTSLYGTYFLDDRTYVESVLSYGHSEARTLRTIEAGSLHRAAFSSRDGEMYSAFVETGRAFELGAWRSEVFGSLHYASLFEDGFRETGAAGLDLIVDARRSETLESELGFRASRAFSTGLGSVTSELRAGWVHDFAIDDRDITARLAGAPDSKFTLRGRDADSNGLRLGGALALSGDDDVLALSAKVETELRESGSNLSGTLQLRVRF